MKNELAWPLWPTPEAAAAADDALLDGGVGNPVVLLKDLSSPAELRKRDRAELPALADELREAILQSVAQTGGHLSSNLGTVELTLALHYVFDTPDDRIVWDVGHQTYAHKMLTGRHAAMATLRKHGGLSGFPRRDESPYDAFGTAHSSTSISAALGMAVAARARGESRRVVAVIGDGAMSAGMAFEALNNAGVIDTDLTGDPQRQRHVDLACSGCSQPLPGATGVGTLLPAGA